MFELLTVKCHLISWDLMFVKSAKLASLIARYFLITKIFCRMRVTTKRDDMVLNI